MLSCTQAPLVMYTPNKLLLSGVNIVGIDPGTTTLGVGIIVVDPQTRLLIDSGAFTINADKLYSDRTLLAATMGSRFARLKAMQDELTRVLCHYEPGLVASEAPFYSRRTASAYGPLVEAMWCIREAVSAYSQYHPLDTVDPPSVKMAIGAARRAKKDEMTEALLKMAGVFNLSPEYILSLDEHSVDALAVAYWRYRALHA